MKGKIMLFKKNQVTDERIKKRSNELSARMLPVFGLLSLVFLVIKIICGLPIMVYLLEISTLVVGALVWLVEELSYGILFVKEKDEMLKELANKAKADAFMAMFWVVLCGELLYLFVVDKAYFLWVLSYVASWLPCALYITIASVSEGLLIFGSRKKEKNIKKILAFRTFIASIFFGLIMGSGFCFHGGTFDPKGLVYILYLAAGWGIPFYLACVAIMKLSEKKADKKMEDMESTYEK